jgi:hypothetical protein
MPKAHTTYNAFDNLHRIQIEQLTFDDTDSLGKVVTMGLLTPINNEVPSLFKRHGYYYLLFGECCSSVDQVVTRVCLLVLRQCQQCMTTAIDFGWTRKFCGTRTKKQSY